MTDLWTFVKNLFKQEQESSPINPFIHEVIERTDNEKEAYSLWTRTLSKRRFLDWVNLEYTKFLVDPDGIDENVDFLNTPSSKGFVLHFDPQLHNRQDFIHFFDYLKERVLSLGYKSSVSDIRTFNRNTGKQIWVETVQRHYLKPKLDISTENQVVQRYGNIKIEVLLRNDHLINLKFSATSYRDYKFTTADDFQDLMKELLQ